MVTLIKGAAGSGKTQTIVDFVIELLEQGVSIKQILFCSYTREGTKAGAARIIDWVGDEYQPYYYPYVRTLHSIAFYEAFASKMNIIDELKIKHFGVKYGYDLREYRGDASYVYLTKESQMLSLHHLERSNKEMFAKQMGKLEVSFTSYERFVSDYKEWKNKAKLLDFTDLLEEFVTKNTPLPIKYAFIDEAQDLNPLMLRFIEVATRDCEGIYFGFDENQTIYSWAGADSRWIVEKSKDPATRLITKPITYRLAPNVLSESEKILTVIKNKIPYSIEAVDPDKKGEVYGIGAIHELNGDHPSNANRNLIGDIHSGEWLILVRDSYSGRDIAKQLKFNGLVFSCDFYLPKDLLPMPHKFPEWVEQYEAIRNGNTEAPAVLGMIESELLRFDNDYSKKWQDAIIGVSNAEVSYYQRVMEKYDNIKKCFPYRIHLSTIHKQKGNEADNVILYLRMIKKVYNNLYLEYENEARLLYVAMTRSRGNQYIMEPQDPNDHSYRQSVYRIQPTAI